jgi:cysteinyl-tRNA synthetase
MSKSLENFYTVADVVKKGFDPLALRYLYLGAHYRDPLNFTWESLEASQKALTKLRNQIAILKDQTDRTILSEEKDKKIEEYRNGFMEAVNDDLNTAKSLAVLWEMLKSNIPSEDKYDLAMTFDEILGLKLNQVSQVLQVPQEIQKLMHQRQELREQGKYEEADKMRDEIIKAGFDVGDKPLK